MGKRDGNGEESAGREAVTSTQRMARNVESVATVRDPQDICGPFYIARGAPTSSSGVALRTPRTGRE